MSNCLINTIIFERSDSWVKNHFHAVSTFIDSILRLSQQIRDPVPLEDHRARWKAVMGERHLGCCDAWPRYYYPAR